MSLKRFILNFYSFKHLCKQNNLKISYINNHRQYEILKEIFVSRIYSDYFPFYEEAVIIDVGSNFGYFSIFAALNLCNNSIIYSIEPSTQNFNILRNNLKNNFKNIITFNYAIGAKNEDGLLNLYQSSNHSIIPDVSNFNTEKIKIKTLNRFVNENEIKRIDFLKIDCEGAEYQILESVESEVFDIIDVISLEFHDTKNKLSNGNTLCKMLIKNDFIIKKFKYSFTNKNLNHGYIIAVKNDLNSKK